MVYPHYVITFRVTPLSGMWPYIMWGRLFYYLSKIVGGGNFLYKSYVFIFNLCYVFIFCMCRVSMFSLCCEVFSLCSRFLVCRM